MKTNNNQLVLGIDYGTDSCRALVVEAATGKERAVGVAEYPRWKNGLYCNPRENQYRQHPADYMDTLVKAVNDAVSQLTEYERKNIKSLSIDTTGSTPAITDKAGTPLSLTKEFADDPDAMFILWKDHTAIAEAERINMLISEKGLSYNKYSGGTYSSEWVWAKVLHVLNHNQHIREKAYSWVEHCDWMSALLTDSTKPEEIRRSRCAAGHKAMWHEEWALPSAEFLSELHPVLGKMREHLYTETFTCDKEAGKLTKEWADRLNLPCGISVGVGAIDAHMGAVGASVAPGILVSIIGTSTCDIMVAKKNTLVNPCIQGISSQVDGSVLPGYEGIEAGQAAFGDIFAWYKKTLSWTLAAMKSDEEAAEITHKLLDRLSHEAELMAPDPEGLVALDWMNGRRTPDANQNLQGMIAGISLSSSAPEIYRALVESTAFGLKRIIEHMHGQGLVIDSINAVGGISKKSAFVMQILSDVIGMPIKIIKSENACALGSAMFAAVISGIYPNIEEAQKHMQSDIEKEYVPRQETKEVYDKLYRKYLLLGKTAEKLIELNN